MIRVMTNKDDDFYIYMGPIFGSRAISTITKDHMYDDDDKTWYISFQDNTPVAYVSVSNNVIKNIWATEEQQLVETLIFIRKNLNILTSTVTKHFKKEIINAGYDIIESKGNNFIKIKGGKKGE